MIVILQINSNEYLSGSSSVVGISRPLSQRLKINEKFIIWQPGTGLYEDKFKSCYVRFLNLVCEVVAIARIIVFGNAVQRLTSNFRLKIVIEMTTQVIF